MSVFLKKKSTSRQTVSKKTISLPVLFMVIKFFTGVANLECVKGIEKNIETRSEK